MLSEICAYLRNYFDRNQPKFYGEIRIEDGALVSFEDKLQNGQYFRIVNSTFNDGVYLYPASGLTDETFSNGSVWAMAVPPDLIALIVEMEAWKTNNAYALNTPYQSESKADYSYTLKSGTDGSGKNNGASALINQFSGRLARWRKL